MREFAETGKGVFGLAAFRAFDSNCDGEIAPDELFEGIVFFYTIFIFWFCFVLKTETSSQFCA